MNIVLFGASGRIGQALLHGLRAAFPEAAVTGCTRHEHTAQSMHLRCFDPCYDDWAQLGHVDILINAAGIFQETIEADFDRVHGGLSSLIVCNRDDIGSPKVIQISALGADEQSPHRFLQTKGAADRILLHSGNAVVVRPSIVCMPGTLLVQKLRMIQNTARLLFRRFPVPRGFARTRIQPVMIDDLVALVTALCSTNGHPPAIDLTGPDDISLGSLPGFLAPAGQKSIRLIEFPVGIVEFLLSLAGLLSLPRPLTREQLRLLLQDNVASNEQARLLLGRPLQPTHQFWLRELSGAPSRQACTRPVVPMGAQPSPD